MSGRKKQQKTRHELEALLRDLTRDMQIVHLKVRPEPILGWSVAFLVPDPLLAADYQPRFLEIEKDLRSQFDLNPETPVSSCDEPEP